MAETVLSFLRSGLRSLAVLFGAHVWMVFNLALAFHPLLAAIYLVFPPVLPLVLGQWLERFSAFMLPTAGVWLVAVSAILYRWGRRMLDLPPIAHLAYLPFFLAWAPLLSGEAVRTIAMHTALVSAKPDCHETRPLIVSLHDWSEHAEAHAWMIAGGKRYIWSYSEMRFVPDSRRWQDGGACRNAL